MLTLAVIVVGKLLFHAIFLPAYEGPDEPYHLARISVFADESLAIALLGDVTPGEIVAAWQARPCSPGVAGAIGCAPYGQSGPAVFNLLRPAPRKWTAPPIPNPENNQPPLFYAVAGLSLRATETLGVPRISPDGRLLALRILGVALVAMGILLLGGIARTVPSGVVAAGLSVMLVPGAAESLARCANDAPVFLWCSGLLVALARNASTRTVATVLALGPLIKLTAIPVIVFAVIALWLRGRRGAAIAGSIASLVVFPIQFARGWWWGGIHELNRPGRGVDDQPLEFLFGLLRSIYSFFKTTIWLGGWSFLRIPLPLIVLTAVCLMTWLAVLRWRRDRPLARAYLAALAAAAAGLLAFALANRNFFGGWGGVGGWYVWGWAPLLWIAAADLCEIDRQYRGRLFSLLGANVIVLNVAFYLIAWRAYSGA